MEGLSNSVSAGKRSGTDYGRSGQVRRRVGASSCRRGIAAGSSIMSVATAAMYRFLHQLQNLADSFKVGIRNFADQTYIVILRRIYISIHVIKIMF